MSESGAPLIRGVFVNSHVKAVAAQKGEAGLDELARLFGRPVNFKNSENVRVQDEVRIIECALRVLTDNAVPEADIPFEAGRLHFRNFSTTPLGKILLPFFRDNFKTVMLRSKHIARHVFQGVRFETKDLGGTMVEIRMENADYHMDHFRGLFQEWMNSYGLVGTVTAAVEGPHAYLYTLTWQ